MRWRHMKAKYSMEKHSPIGPLRHSGVDVLLQLRHFCSIRLYYEKYKQRCQIAFNEKGSMGALESRHVGRSRNRRGDELRLMLF